MLHILPPADAVCFLICFSTTYFSCRYTVTADKAQFSEYTGPRISYTDNALGDELFFKSTPLLFETGTRYFELSGIDAREGEIHLKGFFITEKSTLPFDAFASAFYLVSRYEEYLGDEVDHHGRFHAHNSVAYQQFFLLEPMVDLYAQVVVKTNSRKIS
jgi:hypothetical protein